MTSDPLTNLGKLDLGLRGAVSAFEEEAAAGGIDYTHPMFVSQVFPEVR